MLGPCLPLTTPAASITALWLSHGACWPAFYSSVTPSSFLTQGLCTGHSLPWDALGWLLATQVSSSVTPALTTPALPPGPPSLTSASPCLTVLADWTTPFSFLPYSIVCCLRSPLENKLVQGRAFIHLFQCSIQTLFGMAQMEHAYTEKLLMVYLKFKFARCPVF